MNNLTIRALVGASPAEIETELGVQDLGNRAFEILETDGLDGETLSVILTSAAAVEGMRSLRIIILAFLSKDRRVRISDGTTEVEVSSPADLERVLDHLTG